MLSGVIIVRSAIDREALAISDANKKLNYPKIIQGGMGVAVSGWPLARAVAQKGQLGVVSGTALDLVLTRRLQLGDVGGHVRFALDHFPIKEMATRIWNNYFVPGGKPADKPFKSKPLHAVVPPKALEELMVVGNFVEVFLAKHGHNGQVGINLLEKVQLPTVPSLFGAMLAGVDFVLMGAGIPKQIPAILDKLANCEIAELRLDVSGLPAGEHVSTVFDPATIMGSRDHKLKRPKFLAIVTSASLATMLAKKISPPPDGFVIEEWTAGGHNAPPRGPMQLSEDGQPVYGERDIPELAKFRELGLPFWMAGGYGTPEQLQWALAEGAQGVQVGTAFAFCEESGMLPELKAEGMRRSIEGTAKVFTDPLASPTGFPFKVLQMEHTASNPEVYKNRERICDLGYLREVYMTPEGKVGYRCASEPLDDYVRKGGDVESTCGRKCVCNGLMSTIGMAQVKKDGSLEPQLVTAGDDVAHVSRYLKPGALTYSAAEVIDYLLAESSVEVEPVKGTSAVGSPTA